MLSRSVHRILVAESNRSRRQLVCEHLSTAGFPVMEACDGAIALRSLYEQRPTLVVLAAQLAGLDGRTVLSRIREMSEVPVIVVLEKHTEYEAVCCLGDGADDVIPPSCSLSELLARVEALLRRARYAEHPSMRVVLGDGRLEVNIRSHTVRIDGRQVELSPLEFRLLTTFMKHPGQALTPLQLLEHAWDDHSPVGSERVKFAVARLRHKLTAHGLADPITAVRGIGYRYLPASALRRSRTATDTPPAWR